MKFITLRFKINEVLRAYRPLIPLSLNLQFLLLLSQGKVQNQDRILPAGLMLAASLYSFPVPFFQFFLSTFVSGTFEKKTIESVENGRESFKKDALKNETDE